MEMAIMNVMDMAAETSRAMQGVPMTVTSSLDGVIMLRYAHLFRDRISGGVEQYIKQINIGLLRKHRMTIVQTYLESSDFQRKKFDIEDCERGKIIWVPIHQYTSDRSLMSLWRRLMLLQAMRPPENKSVLHAPVAQILRQLRYRTMIISNRINDILKSEPVDLMLVHRLTYDVPAIVETAQRNNIPFAVVNHFRNRQLSRAMPVLRKAAAVAGVSSTEIPSELESRFRMLSDAVDTEFFNPARTRPVARPEQPMLALLAGRITSGKGHMDMLSIVKLAEGEGVRIAVAFAGVTEDEALVDALKQESANLQLQDRVFFLGELSSEQLRDWYAAADVVVLPSHSEGLPRAMLEAQAMEKPVVAYNAGGTSDAIRGGTTGFLVETADQVAFARKLLWLNEAQRRREMGRRGRQFVSENFSLEALVARHEQLCLDVLRRS